MDGLWYCRLRMPCSFQQGQNIFCDVEAWVTKKQDASQNACLRALAHLLARDSASVRLMPKHWNIPLTVLLEHIGNVLRSERPALPSSPQRTPPHQPFAIEDLPRGRGNESPPPRQQQTIDHVLRNYCLPPPPQQSPSRQPLAHENIVSVQFEAATSSTAQVICLRR